MIKVVHGDLFESNVDALVNTVNTVGVMGKGVALQFKRRYPENFKAYQKAYKNDELAVGKMFIFDLGEVSQPRFIINFPTKKHWRSPSKLEYIDLGLDALVEEIKRLNIQSIAVPALGSSNGGLDWNDVKPRIINKLADLSNVDILVFEPLAEISHKSIARPKKKPNLTLNRALFVKLIDLYREPGYKSGRLEAQKLAYFMQESGQALRLDFQRHHFGPYAHNLNHVLKDLDGHYINGYGDGTGPSNMTIIPDIIPELEAQLHNEPEATQRLDRVSKLIEGFETPYGMELLATTHWLFAHENNTSLDQIKNGFKTWNERKANLFKENHIDIAWQQLKKLEWI